MSSPIESEHFEHVRDHYLISTNPSLLSLSAINTAFATSEMWWCNALPEDELRVCLENSLCFGLYNSQGTERQQIGLARLITDHITWAYLTDVYVVPEEQGKGLGSWLIDCVDEWMGDLNHLRKALLVAGVGAGEEFYSKKLSMERLVQEKNGTVTMCRLGPALRSKSA